MFLVEFTTEANTLYTANVVTQKIQRLGPDDKTPSNAKYKELRGGAVGQELVIVWPDDSETPTNKITKLAFPEVD